MTRETPMPAATDPARLATAGTVTGLPPSRPVWAYWACWVTIAFIPIHVYWAMGGTFWLPAAVLSPSYTTALQLANWGVSVLLAIGAAVVLALTRTVGRRVHPALLLAPIWVGSAVCGSHAVFGFVTKTLYLAGMHGAVNFPALPGVSEAEAAAANHTAAVLDLAVFEPWFLIEGVLLLLAGRQFLRTPKARRWWTASLIVGTALIVLFGAALAVTDQQVAVH
jgi:hypothetical protein